MIVGAPCDDRARSWVYLDWSIFHGAEIRLSVVKIVIIECLTWRPSSAVRLEVDIQNTCPANCVGRIWKLRYICSFLSRCPPLENA